MFSVFVSLWLTSSRVLHHLQFTIHNNEELNKLFGHIITPRVASSQCILNSICSCGFQTQWP